MLLFHTFVYNALILTVSALHNVIIQKTQNTIDKNAQELRCFVFDSLFSRDEESTNFTNFTNLATKLNSVQLVFVH